jgi:hypothetical protein
MNRDDDRRAAPSRRLSRQHRTAAAGLVGTALVASSLGACGPQDGANQGRASAAPLAAGSLAAYWTLDGTRQAVSDASGDGYTGWLGTSSAVESSDPTPVTGKINGALAFNGTSSLVTIEGGAAPSGLNGFSAFTYAAWIKPSGWGGNGYGRIVSAESSAGFDDHYVYIMGSSKTLGVRIADSLGGHDTLAPSGAIVLGTWTHVAVTYDDATDRKAHLYINGKEVTSYAQQPAASGSLVPPIDSFTIGNRPARNRSFAGVIDEVRVYGTALSASDVAQLPTMTGPPPDAGADGATATDAGPVSPLALCPTATAATRYVSPSGSDGNPGTASAPFLTIQHAADVSGPGDVVHVIAGAYTGSTSPLGYIRNSGTASQPLVFCSDPPGAAKLDVQTTLSTGWFLQGSYVHVLGFEVTGFVNAGASVWAPGGVLVGNDIHDIGHVCSDSSNGKVGVYMVTSDVLVDGNVIHSIGRLSPGEQGCNPSTTYYENLDHGIYVESSTNVTITNNIIYDSRHGWDIQVYSGSSTGSSNLLIANNTFAFPNPYRQGQVLLSLPSVSNAIVENNVFYEPQVEGVRFSSGGSFSNITVESNITTGGVITASNPGGSVVVSGNYDSTDALLVSPSTFDFHLQPVSPAIDHGQTIPRVTTDIEATPRPQGAAYDIGAYEWHP